METYEIKLIDGSIQRYDTSEYQIFVKESGIKILQDHTWGEVIFIPITSVLYYRKEREDV